MYVVERDRPEQHFSEGEPDLEPPEELAIGELDDESMLEEELDNEDLLEEDVDDDLLTVTLEDLIHVGDDEAMSGATRPGPAANGLGTDVADDEFVCGACLLVKRRSQLGHADARLCRDCGG